MSDTSLLSRLKSMDKLIGKSLKVNVQMLANAKYNDLINEIKEETSFLNEDASVTNRVYCIFNEIKEKPKCECGGYLNFFRFSTGYNKFCRQGCPAQVKMSGEAVKKKYANITDEEKNKIVDQRKKTNIEKYGVDNYFKVTEFIENNFNPELVAKRDANRVKSMQAKHGVDNVFQLDSVKKKIVDTSIEKYGHSSHMTRLLSNDAIDILEDKDQLSKLLNKNSKHYIAFRVLNCYTSVVDRYIKLHDIEYIPRKGSTEEQVVEFILEQNNISKLSFERGDRTVLSNNKELDFYFPDYKYAVEVNGVYWHSERVRPDINYHQDKFDIAKSKGIHLVQFWDFEINNKTDVVASMILRSIRKIKNKIRNDECTISEITLVNASEFIEFNHLEAITPNNISLSYGMYHEDELVSVMTFKKINDKYMMNRHCDLVHHEVIDSFQVLLNHFITNNEFDKLYGFSNDRYTNGEIYKLNGFSLISDGEISQYYRKSNFEGLLNYGIKKDRLEKMLDVYNPEISESQNMQANGWHRVNGCRVKKWEYNKKDL